jgi:hypothetical protein
VTEAAHDFARSVAREPLRRGIPAKDATIRVHEANAVIVFVEHLLEKVVENGNVIGFLVVPYTVLPIDAES